MSAKQPETRAAELDGGPQDSHGASLPLLNARTWAIGFLIFAVVLAVVFSQLVIGFMAQAH